MPCRSMSPPRRAIPTSGPDLAALQHEVANLRKLVGQPPAAVPAGPARTRDLFQPEPGPLTTGEWQMLRKLAGPAPSRIGGAERVQQGMRAEAAGLLAEADLGAAALEEGGSGLGCGDAGPTSSPAGHSDLDAAAPVAETFGCSQRSFKRIGQRARQLQQRGPRHTAREAYVRQLEDHATVAQTILENAAAGLGVSPTSAPPGLLREFLDKKVALSEHKTLGYLATYLAFQWQAARESRNTEMEAWAGRGVMAIEQMVLDNGRLQIGWLMTGCPEPVFPPNAQLKRQGSTRPFAKLAKPAWAAACLAYVQGAGLPRSQAEGSPGKIDDDNGSHDRCSTYRSEAKGKVEAEEPKARRCRRLGELGPSSFSRADKQSAGSGPEARAPKFCSTFELAASAQTCTRSEAHFHKQAVGAGSGMEPHPSPAKPTRGFARLSSTAGSVFQAQLSTWGCACF